MTENDQILHALELGQAIGRKSMGQEISAEEAHMLEIWENTSAANRQSMERLHSEEFQMEALALMHQVSVKEGWQRLSMKRNKSIHSYRPIVITALAAASVIILFAVGFKYLLPNHPARVNKQQAGVPPYDIGPATNKATLSINSGKPISLPFSADTLLSTPSAILRSQNGMLTIKSPASGKQVAASLSVVTPKGGTYFIRLMDGTGIWLNADTRLSFPDRFADGKRQISIEGEAYLEVAADENRPFWVHSPQGTIQVLGTRFNVKSYLIESSEQITLLSGRIKVNGDGFSTLLKPGEMAAINANGIKLSTADTANIMAWKNGMFVFHNAAAGEVFEEVARWYDLTVVYDGSFMEKETRISTRIKRQEPLSRVLRIMEASAIASFKIEDKKLIIFPYKKRRTDNQP